MRKIVIGVMGPGEQATEGDRHHAYELGKQIAQQGWVLLTGGRNVGVMDAANQGAKQSGGLTIGILPGRETSSMSDAIDIAIMTDLGHARNSVNVLSSDVVIACGMGLGTASEVALALKSDKPVILLNVDQATQVFFKTLSKGVIVVDTPDAAIQQVRAWGITRQTGNAAQSVLPQQE